MMIWLLLVLAALLGWLLLISFAAEGSALARRISATPVFIIYLAISTLFAWYANWEVTDRRIYERELHVLQQLGPAEAFSTIPAEAQEPLYLIFAWIVSQFAQTHQVLFAVVALFAGGLQLLALAGLQTARQISIVWILTISMGFYTAYVSVIARQGLSMAFIFAGVAMWILYRRRVLGMCLLTAGALFHWSAIPVVVMLTFFLLLGVSRRILLVLWGGLATLFVLGINRAVIGPFESYIPSLSVYSSSELASVYQSGTNRLDFLLFSALILLVGLFSEKYLDLPAWYGTFLNTYIFLNLYFLLFGFIYYSDRLAAYSWYFAPIILGLPVASLRGNAGRIVFYLVLIGIMIYSLLWGPLGLLANLLAM